jgi:hypothetical protein
LTLFAARLDSRSICLMATASSAAMAGMVPPIDLATSLGLI